MKSSQSIPLLLSQNADALRGIYTRSDLTHLFGTDQPSTVAKRIESLIQQNFLTRACNGYFYVEGATLASLAQRIFPDGYLSLQAGLNHHGMCGSLRKSHVDILTTKSHPKKIQTPLGSIHMHVQKKKLHFGYHFDRGIQFAEPEKCFIDTCYFHLRSPSPFFNLYGDLILSKCSLSNIKRILEHYQNPKISQFVLQLSESYGIKT